MADYMSNFGFFLSRTFASTRANKTEWPFIPGRYHVVSPHAPVAVTTLGSVKLASDIAESPPEGLCIVGKVETENIGIEKIIKNILSSAAIRYLVCAGNEPPKHLTGATLFALFNNGIDVHGRIIGSPGMRPVLPNTSAEEIQAFRDQVEPIDMIGCTDVAEIHARVAELASSGPKTTKREFVPSSNLREQGGVERVLARGKGRNEIKLDEEGYFVINIEDRSLLVEHYNYKEKLQRVIEGRDARSIYLTIVQNGWVSKLDHAAYLGKELAKAELSIKHGLDFVQDGA